MKKNKKIALGIILSILLTLSIAVITACPPDPAVHTVSFMNGTTVVSSSQIEDGRTATAPPAPSAHLGHTFLFWGLSPDANEGFNFSTPITAPLTLHAVWQPIELTAAFFDGANQIAAVPIYHGSTVTPPAPPASPNSSTFFRHWSATQGGTAFNFDTPILENRSFFAVWIILNPLNPEFYISFDLNYDEAINHPAPMQTIGRRLTQSPISPVRNGYIFSGWWVSMFDDADKLSFRFETIETLFEEPKTLFALWESTASPAPRLASPIVNVTQTNISWNPIAGSLRDYRVQIEGPIGSDFSNIDTTQIGTTRTINFASLPEGNYTITITAQHTSGNENQHSIPAVRHFRNRALARVTHFYVTDNGILRFNRINNAAAYRVRFDCLNTNHNLLVNTNLDNPSLDFRHLPVPLNGFSFTIEALAPNHISSMSDIFNWDRRLGTVENFEFDEDTAALSWDNVPYATNYQVQIKYADDSHLENRTVLAPADPNENPSILLPFRNRGSITVIVMPIASGFNTNTTTHEFTKIRHATPVININTAESTINWSPALGASGYELHIGDIIIKLLSDQISISLHDERIILTPGASAPVKVRALGTNDYQHSLFSASVNLTSAPFDTFDYHNRTVSWDAVMGILEYRIRIDFDDNENNWYFTALNSIEIGAFKRAGETAIEISVFDGENWSAWLAIFVDVFEISFMDGDNNQIGSSVFAAQHDVITLPFIDGLDYPLIGHSLDGWALSHGDNPIILGENNTYVFSGTQNRNFYAVWTALPFVINFNFNYDAVSSNPAPQTIVFGTEFSLPAPTIENRFTLDGRSFIGWNTRRDGTGQRVANELGHGIGTWNIDESITLYAQWVQLFNFGLISNNTQYQISALIVERQAYVCVYENCRVPEGQICNYPHHRLYNISVIDIFQINTLFIPANRQGYNYAALPVLNENNQPVLDEEGNPKYKNVPILDEQPKPITTIAALSFNFTFNDVITNVIRNVVSPRYIIIPSNITTIDEGAFSGCINLVSFEVAAANANYTEINGVLFRFAQNIGGQIIRTQFELVHFPAQRDYTVYTLPQGTVYIGHYAFRNNSRLTELNIPDTVTRIGRGAFQNMTALTALILPPDISGIANDTFNGASSIAQMVIPGSVLDIGARAFSNMTALTSVIFEESTVDCDCTGVCDGNCYIPFMMGSHAFAGNPNLANVIFEPGSGVTMISDNAFSGARSLSTIELPSSLRTIGSNAFYFLGRDVLNPQNIHPVSVSFAPNSRLEEIQTAAFHGGWGLTSIELPPSLRRIGNNAFQSCLYLTSVTFPLGSQLEFIGSGAFSGNIVLDTFGVPRQDGTHSIPDTVLHIGSTAFSSTRQLNFANSAGDIILPSNLTTIGNNAFSNAGLSGNLIVPSSVQDTRRYNDAGEFAGMTQGIGDSAFANTDIKKVYFETGNNPLSLGDAIFSSTQNLTHIYFSKNVIRITTSVFRGASALEYVGVDEDHTGAGVEGLFGYISYGGVLFRILPPRPPHYRPLELVVVPSAMETFIMPEDLIHINDRTFQDVTGLTNIVISKNVQTIGQWVFQGATNLENVEFEEGVESIGHLAFMSTALTRVDLPASLIHLDTSAFTGLQSLYYIGVNEDNPMFSSHDGVLFNKDKTVLLIYPTARGSTERAAARAAASEQDRENGNYAWEHEFVVPEGVTNINLRAFDGNTNITNIILPSTLRDTPIVGAPPSYVFSASSFGSNVFTLPKTTAQLAYSNNHNTVTVDFDLAVTSHTYVFARYPSPLPPPLEGTTTNDLFLRRIGLFALTHRNGAPVPDNQIWTVEITAREIVFNPPAPSSLSFRYARNASFVETTNAAGQLNNVLSQASHTTHGYNFMITPPLATALGYHNQIAALDGVIVIDQFVYQNPSGVANVTYAGSYVITKIPAIGQFAFARTTNLKSIIIPEGAGTIGQRAFQNSGISNITLPDGLRRIEEAAFENCFNLLSIIIPSSVTCIGSNAPPRRVFEGCTNLTIFIEADFAIPRITLAAPRLAPSTPTSMTPFPTPIEWSVPFGVRLHGTAINQPPPSFLPFPHWQNRGWQDFNTQNPVRPVIWGATLSVCRTFVVSLESGQSRIANYGRDPQTPPPSISAPYRHGYYFIEWNTASDGTGTAYSLNDLPSGNITTTLYAIWVKQTP